MSKQEIEAVAALDARMKAVEPIYRAFEEKRNEINVWRATRLKNAKTVVTAVRTWAKEHQKVTEALEHGTDISAFNLRYILSELDRNQ